MSVPEAAMNEYNLVMANKNNVWLPRKGGNMKTKTVSHPVKERPY